eukprot:2542988-Rhodomonas_salina.1
MRLTVASSLQESDSEGKESGKDNAASPRRVAGPGSGSVAAQPVAPVSSAVSELEEAQAAGRASLQDQSPASRMKYAMYTDTRRHHGQHGPGVLQGHPRDASVLEHVTPSPCSPARPGPACILPVARLGEDYVGRHVGTPPITVPRQPGLGSVMQPMALYGAAPVPVRPGAPGGPGATRLSLGGATSGHGAMAGQQPLSLASQLQPPTAVQTPMPVRITLAPTGFWQSHPASPPRAPASAGKERAPVSESKRGGDKSGKIQENHKGGAKEAEQGRAGADQPATAHRDVGADSEAAQSRAQRTASASREASAQSQSASAEQAAGPLHVECQTASAEKEKEDAATCMAMLQQAALAQAHADIRGRDIDRVGAPSRGQGQASGFGGAGADGAGSETDERGDEDMDYDAAEVGTLHWYPSLPEPGSQTLLACLTCSLRFKDSANLLVTCVKPSGSD